MHPSFDIWQLLAGCTTIGGPDIGKRCIFPFTFNGRQYRGCLVTRAFGATVPQHARMTQVRIYCVLREALNKQDRQRSSMKL